MGLEKRTVKILVSVIIVLLILGAILGLVLGLVLNQRYVELDVYPRSEEFTWNQPLIHFRPSDTGSWHHWIRRINEMLREYETTVPEEPPRAPCSTHNRREQHQRSELCDRAMRVWGPCTADNFYGYPEGQPCVFLRLSHIHYWYPEPYNSSTSLMLPHDMPMYLRQIVERHDARSYGDYIWVSCDGEFNADKENVGPIQYIPAALPPGYPTSRLHTADKLARFERRLPDTVPGPLIAIFFENPNRGTVINVECRVWSRDIYYDGASRVGRARFELFIE